MTAPRRRWSFWTRTLLIGVAPLAALAWLGAPSQAQVVPLAMSPNLKLKARRSAVVADLRGKNFRAIDAGQFEEYFNDYFLQQFVVVPEKPRTLGDLRTELRTRYFGSGKSGGPYDRLNGLVFNFMKAILARDFDMEVKYNAMMVIGDLNETEGDLGTGVKPKPHLKAQEFLVRACNNPDLPVFLRAAALLGIMRHASLQTDSAGPD